MDSGQHEEVRPVEALIPALPHPSTRTTNPLSSSSPLLPPTSQPVAIQFAAPPSHPRKFKTTKTGKSMLTMLQKLQSLMHLLGFGRSGGRRSCEEGGGGVYCRSWRRSVPDRGVTVRCRSTYHIVFTHIHIHTQIQIQS